MINRERVCHILKKNHGNERPRFVLFFDTETTPLKLNDKDTQNVLKLGCACLVRYNHKKHTEKREWFDFTDKESLWNYIEEKAPNKGKLVIVAHSLDFDMMVVDGFTELENREWLRISTIINGISNIWRFRKDKKTLQFIENMNFFVMSIAKLGETIGLDKLTIDFETCTDEELRFYCHRDVEIMVEAWSRWFDFIDENDLGCWGPTITSQAFNAYRHRFMPCEILVHTNVEATKLERESYHGGRTECFKIGTFEDGPFYMYDVNSMYPYVMSCNPFPVKHVSTRKRGDIDNLQTNIKQYLCIAECEIKTDTRFYPVRLNGRLTFPIGHFITYLCTPEILYALKHNELINLGQVNLYEGQNIFREYVTWCYDKRKEYKEQGNYTYSDMTKRLMNHLYGKFGQLLDVWETLPVKLTEGNKVWKEWNMDTQKLETYRSICGVTEVSVGKEEGYNSFPGIASHVTAYARCELWRLIVKAGENNVYYCDTDSLIVNEDGHNRLSASLNETKLGMLKLEEKTDTLIIRNCKDYTFGSKVKLKGVSKRAKKLDDDVYKQNHTVHLLGALREGTLDKCITRDVVKHISTTYQKGTVLTDGEVRPFRLTL